MFKIKEIREMKGLGVNELSRLSGVNASYISALERGEKENPTITTLKKLADTLNVTLDELMKSEQLDLKKLDNQCNYVKEECALYETGEFETVDAAMQFILNQKVIMSDLKLENMTDKDKINFANELYTMMKMLAPKYRK